jgi:periplasmic protein TonB
MEAGSQSKAVTFSRLLQSDVRIALRRDEDGGWLLAAATLGAIALHVLMIVGAVEHWPERASPSEPAVFAELIVEPPAPAVEAEPQREPEAAAPPPERQELRQSGGDPDRAPGGATPEPEAQASAPPPEPVPELIEEPQPVIAAAIPPPARKPPPPARAQQKSPERAAARTEVPGHDAGEGEDGGDRYLNEIRDSILKQHNYPAVFNPLRLSGTAYYDILINRAGALLGAKLVRTSGIGTLDQVGMGMIRRAAPFPPVPDDMDGERIVLSLKLYLGPQGER